MTTIPEYCVKLHAPAFIIDENWQRCLYTLLYRRQIILTHGYAGELFDGELLYVPKDREIRAFVESVIAEIKERNRGLKRYNVTLYIYKVANFELTERWVFEVNTDYDATAQLSSKRGDFIGKIAEKIDALLPLTETCFFAVMMRDSAETQSS